MITGVSTGNATITYTVSNGCGTFTASKTIAVSPAANPGTLSGSSSVCTGSSVTFTRSGGTSGGTWSSSNTSIATVNNSGTVTGVGAGTAVISYAVTSGCGTTSATKSITVSQSPSITVSNITASTDPNNCSASITLGSNVTVTGGPVTLQYRIGFYWLSYPISSTHTFYRGTTPVTVIATNSCGITARIFLVTVNDNQAPTITCKPNATRSANGSGKYSIHGHEFDATATDGCGIASLEHSLSGATVDHFESSPLSSEKLNIGTTTITWRATDVNGNVSTCSTQVTVTAAHGAANPADFAAANPQPLTVKVAPNPSSFYFTLAVNSESPEKVALSVTDLLGRPVQKIDNITPGSTIQIGGKYRPGIYIVHLSQGQQSISLKLIKEGK